MKTLDILHQTFDDFTQTRIDIEDIENPTYSESGRIVLNFIDIKMGIDTFIPALIGNLVKHNIPMQFIGEHKTMLQAIVDPDDKLHNEYRTKYCRRELLKSGFEQNDIVGNWFFTVENGTFTTLVTRPQIVDIDVDKLYNGDICFVCSKRCYDCSSKLNYIYKFVDGVFTLQTIGEHPCYHGHPFNVELNFKAGDRIMFGDWLGGSMITQADYGLDSCFHGEELNTRAYADYNIGSMYVGNSCPGVYKFGNRIYIGRHPDILTGTTDDEDSDALKDGVTLMGGIITDRWSVIIATADDIRKMPTLAEGREDIKVTENSGEQFDRASFEFVPETDVTFKMTVFPIQDTDDSATCYAIIDIIEQ